MKVNIFAILVLFYFNIETHGIEILTAKDSIIVKTESSIRNITNDLFLAVKLKGVKRNPTLRQYSLIHNFFTSITLKDFDTLSRIAALSRADVTNINNETNSLMDAVNELLSENSNIDMEELNRYNIQEYVNTFLTNLEYLKKSNDANDKTYYNINSQVLRILQTDDIFNEPQDEEDSDENDSALSDNEFWVPEQSGRRIYQGDRTKIKYFPFMASIQIFNSFQCGGCIIKSDIVITAASCLQLAWNNRFFRENPAFLSVRIGSNYYNGGGESIPVLEVYFHPSYDPKTLKNNICLLRLMRRIKFKRKNRKVKKIDFDRNPSGLPLTTDGITIVGWGAKGSSNVMRDPRSNQLSFSVLDIYPLRECQDIYTSQYVTYNNFCAGFFSKGGGACHGDVGGPGIVDGILAGVVSFGSPRCGTPDAPTVFTKLGYYTDWIESIMEQDVPYSRQETTLRPPPLPITMAHKYDITNPTTFKIQPVFGKLKPIPINQVEPEPLRILDDEDLFKEFLATMFGSKEAKEYEELFATKDTEKPKQIKRDKKERVADLPKNNDESVAFVTQFVEEHDTTRPYKKFTVFDKNLMLDHKETDLSDDDENVMKTVKVNEKNLNEVNDDDIDRNIAKLIDNIDVSSDSEKTAPDNDSTEEFVINKESPSYVKPKNIDDSILTLLYLSDSEKNGMLGNVNDDFDEEGLSIAIDGFKDLTFRNNGTQKEAVFHNALQKNEIFELLAEAIDDVAKNKGT